MQVKRWKGWALMGAVAAFFWGMYLARPQNGMDHGPAGVSPIELTPPARVPAPFQEGQGLFQTRCAPCHGQWAEGSDQGPPLAHDDYRPGHHADFAFVRAVENGVRAHHWRFGDMPRQPDVSRGQVEAIVAFIRWWQRENGIH